MIYAIVSLLPKSCSKISGTDLATVREYVNNVLGCPECRKGDIGGLELTIHGVYDDSKVTVHQRINELSIELFGDVISTLYDHKSVLDHPVGSLVLSWLDADKKLISVSKIEKISRMGWTGYYDCVDAKSLGVILSIPIEKIDLHESGEWLTHSLINQAINSSDNNKQPSELMRLQSLLDEEKSQKREAEIINQQLQIKIRFLESQIQLLETEVELEHSTNVKLNSIINNKSQSKFNTQKKTYESQNLSNSNLSLSRLVEEIKRYDKGRLRESKIIRYNPPLDEFGTILFNKFKNVNDNNAK